MDKKYYHPEAQQNRFSLSKKLKQTRFLTANQIFAKYRLAQSMEALVLGIAVYFTALVIYQITYPGFYLAPTFQDFDISVLFLIDLLLKSILDASPVSFFLFALAWVIVSIHSKRKYGNNVVEILFGSLLIPSMFTIAIVLMVGLSLLPLGTVTIYLVVIVIVQFVIVGLVTIVILMVPGILASRLVSIQESYQVKTEIEPYYLILNVVPPNESQQFCPFKMVDSAGCSYLGYKAPPNRAIICDYKSTYLRCTVYAHIYKKVISSEV